jgi:hypothetical protein
MYFVPQRLQYLNIKTPIFCQEKNLVHKKGIKSFHSQKASKGIFMEQEAGWETFGTESPQRSVLILG